MPFLIVMIVDGCLTLAGQSSDYWKSNYAHVSEGTPVFANLLRTHPAAFIAGLLSIGAVMSVLVLLLPRILAMTMSLAATIGHTYGATTWLAYYFRVSGASCQMFFFCVALVYSLCFVLSYFPQRDRPLLAESPVTRSILLATLAAILAYMFLL
jgi:hypothetical protein